MRIQLQAISNLVANGNERNVDMHQRMLHMLEHFKALRSLSSLELALPALTELDGRDMKRSCIDSFDDPMCLDEQKKVKLARLLLSKEKVETMKNQRETLLKEFRHKLQNDDITKLVLLQRQGNQRVSKRVQCLAWLILEAELLSRVCSPRR